MPAPLPEAIKSKVIEQWLLGQSRDSIAKANNISTGAVSNIAKEYEERLGRDVLYGLREIGILLKREGITPAQCAIGFRIMKMFTDQRVDGEVAEHFVSDMYKECDRLGITPSNMVVHIEDLTKFSKDVRLPEIKDYVNNKIVQEKELDDKIRQHSDDIAGLELKKSQLEREYDLILEQSRRVEEGMKSYFGFKQELESHGISMTDDIPRFASTVKCIAEYGYDTQRVINEFNDTQYHQRKLRALQIAADEKQKDVARHESQNSSLVRDISLHSSILNVYNELDNAGFGIEKLKGLHKTIKKIAESNQIGTGAAVDKFFKDTETQYDAKLGFEAERDRLKTEIQVLKEKRKKELESLREQPFIGPIILRLIQLGLTEDEMLESSKMLLNLFKGPYSVKDIALGMIETIRAMVISRTRTSSGDRTIEILDKTREELSKLD